ncbi:MAG: NAD(P)H-binding protein [Halarcobacter ebronensis]
MKVLLTGSTGYIGRRLKQRLIQNQDIDLRLYVRNKKTLSQNLPSNIDVVEGDTFNKEKLEEALKDVDTAFYLVHSLSRSDYKNLDKQSAQNFLDAAIEVWS